MSKLATDCCRILARFVELEKEKGVYTMILGRNRAENRNLNETFSIEKSNKPCVFLSHRSLDKTMVREIGNYIIKAGIDIYLDENDAKLQAASQAKDDQLITQCIQEGIKNSTHVLCLLSNVTVNSWWVPYEIGYGDMAKRGISSMALKELKSEPPSFLKIHGYLNDIEDLNKYLMDITNTYGVLQEQVIFESFSTSRYNESYKPSIIKKSITHPLAKYLR